MYKYLLIAVLSIFGFGCHPRQNSTQETIKMVRPAIFKLVRPESSCTAFHVGKGIFVTAKHCVDDQSTSDYKLVDYKNVDHQAYVLDASPDSDVALLFSDEVPSKIDLWNNNAEVQIGVPLISLGFPGYFYSEFMFETGFLNSINIINGEELYFSKNLIYMGESGGPIVDSTTGRLVGISSSFLERVKFFDDGPMHQHNTISMIIPWKRVSELISQAKVSLE